MTATTTLATDLLDQEYGDKGLVVLGFPSNDFMGQEPGTDSGPGGVR